MICRVVAEIISYIAIGDDVAGPRENPFGVGASPDQTRNTARFMDGDLLITLHRVLVAANLRDHGIAQAKSLVAMLLHVFDIDVVSFRNVDRANCFEKTERDYRVDSAGHLVGRRRAQANRRSNRLQAGNRLAHRRFHFGKARSLQLTERFRTSDRRGVIADVAMSAFGARECARFRATWRSCRVRGRNSCRRCRLELGDFPDRRIFVTATRSVEARRSGEKPKRIGSIVEKGDERDAMQVFANGGIFAVAAIADLISHSPDLVRDRYRRAGGIRRLTPGRQRLEPWLAASRFRSSPVDALPAGTSGGVTTLAGCRGSRRRVVHRRRGGAGAVACSLRRRGTGRNSWCVGRFPSRSDAPGPPLVRRMRKPTERLVHDCGGSTRRTGGVGGLDNNAVNAVCSAVGALVALLLSR